MTAPTALLHAARSGDPRAFAELVAPYRDELQAHCYRMLGSLHDAEDVVQESLARAWRSVGRLDERGFVRAWLYTIATNRCLTAIDQRRRASCPSTSRPARRRPRSAGSSPTPASRPRRSISPARASSSRSSRRCSTCPRRQRAVLILREVLGFSAAEVAGQLGTSTASVNSALQRARKAIDSAAPTQQAVLRDLGDAAVADLVTRWTDAWQAGDVDAIVAMLAADARYSMPPLPQWYRGQDEIRAFLRDGPLQSRWRFLPTTANSQLAFGTYLWEDAAGAYVPGGLDVLTLHEGRVAEVVAFLSADFTRFGLPARLRP